MERRRKGEMNERGLTGKCQVTRRKKCKNERAINVERRRRKIRRKGCRKEDNGKKMTRKI